MLLNLRIWLSVQIFVCLLKADKLLLSFSTDQSNVILWILFLVYGPSLKTDQSDFYILWPPVLVTYPNRVGQGEGDSQGETLGDSHHKHRHSDDEVEDKRLYVLGCFVCLPGLAVDAELDHTELDDQNQHHQYSHSRACRQKDKGWVTLI